MNPDYSDEKLIRDYLLGRLKQPQQDEIENRLQADPALEELASVVEDEIIDEYLDAPQTHPDRRDIETHFLRPPQRRAKLAFQKSLRQHLSGESRTKGNGSGSSLPNPPFYLRSAGAGAAWLMLLIMTIASALYITKLRQNLRSETARKQEVETSLKAQKAQLAQANAETDGLRKQVAALKTTLPVHPAQQESSIAMVVLSPGTRGDAGENSVTLSPKTRSLEAQVGLDAAPPPKSCSIAVYSPDQRKIWSQIDRTPCTRRDSGVLTFRIPTRRLSPGTYSAEITLQWDRPGRPRTYYFRVAR
jgi:hypothetical protein